MRYGLIYWGNTLDNKSIFILQIRVARVMTGANRGNPVEHFLKN